jgi:hypothetical protein
MSYFIIQRSSNNFRSKHCTAGSGRWKWRTKTTSQGKAGESSNMAGEEGTEEVEADEKVNCICIVLLK